MTVDVLTNDSDADGDMLAIATFGQGADGTVTLDDNGTPGDTGDDRLVYTPGAGFSGSDSFTYTVEDGQGGSDTATVTVSEGTPPPPFELNINAGGGAYTASDGTQFVADTYFSGGTAYSDSFAVAGTPDDPIFQSWRSRSFSYAIDVAPGTYSVELHFAENLWENAGDRVFDILAEGGIILDNFDVVAAAGARYTAYTTLPITVEVTDGVLNLDFDSEKRNPIVSAISIRSVSGDGAVPVGVDDAYAVDEDGALTVNAANGLLANDSDADGDTLTASVATDPENGTLTLNADGSFTYVPDADFSGSDSFLYAVSDGTGRVAQATATITVNPLNDDPVAVDDEAISDGSAVTVDVLTNDTDADADMLAIATFGQGADGTCHARRQRHAWRYRRRPAGLHAGRGLLWVRQLHLYGRGRPGRQRHRDGDGERGHPRRRPSSSTSTQAAAPTLRLTATNTSPTPTSPEALQIRTRNRSLAPTIRPASELAVAVVQLCDRRRERHLRRSTCSSPRIYWENAGDRVFDILAEGGNGARQLRRLRRRGRQIHRPYHAADHGRGDRRGRSNLDFDSEKRKPIVSAISIRAVSGDGAVPVGVDDAYAVDEDGALTVNAANGRAGQRQRCRWRHAYSERCDRSRERDAHTQRRWFVHLYAGRRLLGVGQLHLRSVRRTGRVAQATATITVNPLNDEPVAVDDAAISDGVGGDGRRSDQRQRRRRRPAVAGLVRPGRGRHGHAGRQRHAGRTGDDMLVYTPGAGFSGTDSFTYTVEDGQGGSDTATVTVSEGTPPPPFELNINAGGGAYTASDGNAVRRRHLLLGGTPFRQLSRSPAREDDPISTRAGGRQTFGYEIAGRERHLRGRPALCRESTGRRPASGYFDIKIEGGIGARQLRRLAAAGGNRHRLHDGADHWSR